MTIEPTKEEIQQFNEAVKGAEPANLPKAEKKPVSFADKLKKMSTAQLRGETVRRISIKRPPLRAAYALVLAIQLGWRNGNDPYCLKTAKRPKRTRVKKA